MSHLPTCKQWTFNAGGLLVDDWLLSPPRPLDVTYTWQKNSITPQRVALTTEHSSSHRLISICLYFALTLLPLLTGLLSLANTVNELRFYTLRLANGRRFAVHRFSVNLIIFFASSLAASMATWSISLSRYIPGSPSGNHGNQTASSDLVAALPRLLTTQAVLHTTSLWLIITLTICQLIQHSRVNSKQIALKDWDSYLKQMYNSLIVCRPNTCGGVGREPDKGRESFGCSLCCVHRSSLPADAPNMVAFNNEAASDCCIHYPYYRDYQYCSARLVMRKISLLVVLVSGAIALCLPQLWSYTMDSDSTNAIRILTHNVVNPAYEYCIAVLTLVIPACVLIITLTLLLINAIRCKNMLQLINCFSHPQFNPNQCRSDAKVVRHQRAVLVHCLSSMSGDSCLILLVGVVTIFTWLPSAIVSTGQRLNCLLTSTTQSAEIGSGGDDQSWPYRRDWLYIEMFRLVGDSVVQTICLITRLLVKGRRPGNCFPMYDDVTDAAESESSDGASTFSRGDRRTGVQLTRAQSDRSYSQSTRIPPCQWNQLPVDDHPESASRNTLSPCFSHHQPYGSQTPPSAIQFSPRLDQHPIDFSPMLSTARVYCSRPSPLTSPHSRRQLYLKPQHKSVLAVENDALHQLNQHRAPIIPGDSDRGHCRQRVTLTYSPRSRHPPRPGFASRSPADAASPQLRLASLNGSPKVVRIHDDSPCALSPVQGRRCFVEVTPGHLISSELSTQDLQHEC